MTLHMIVKMSGLYKLPGTVGTLIRAFTRVCLQVVVQMAGLPEGLLTDYTGIRALARVQYHVPTKPSPVSELL